MNQEYYQEGRRIRKKSSRRKKVLLKNFKFVWWIFVLLAGPVGVILFLLGNHVNNFSLVLLGFGGMLVEAVTGVIIAIAAKITRMKRYWKKTHHVQPRT